MSTVVEQERIRLLTETFVLNQIDIKSFECLVEQVLKGNQPTMNGIPIIADPGLYQEDRIKIVKTWV